MKTVAYVGQVEVRIGRALKVIKRTNDFPVELLMIVITDAADVVWEPTVVPSCVVPKVKFYSAVRVGIHAAIVIAVRGRRHIDRPVCYEQY